MIRDWHTSASTWIAAKSLAAAEAASSAASSATILGGLFNQSTFDPKPAFRCTWTPGTNATLRRTSTATWTWAASGGFGSADSWVKAAGQ